MHTKYRPFFILISLFFLGASAYFFIGLGNNFYDDTLKQARKASDIKDLDVSISRKNITKNKRMYTIVTYTLVNLDCPLKWEMHIDSAPSAHNLSMHEVTPMGKCKLEGEEVENLNMSVFKKMNHQFDSKKFSHFSLSKNVGRKFMDLLLVSFNLRAKKAPFQTDEYGRRYFFFDHELGK